MKAAGWLAARRRYRLILRPDRLEQLTWRGRTVIPLHNTTAEIRIPAGLRAARTAYLPCLRSSSVRRPISRSGTFLF